MEKILLIDDDEGLIHFLGRFFQRKGYDVVSCLNGLSAVEKISEEPFDLILLDYKMPGMNGLETLKSIRQAQVRTPVILMTAYGNTDLTIEAIKYGAYDYIIKPFEREELSRIVSEALLVNRQMKETVSFPHSALAASPPRKDALTMIGGSRKMQEVYKLIGQIAEKDVSVLITGESGTGKELAAKAIYHHSRRKEAPFIPLNCAAIPENLFESELFGYERGAFTGADRTYIGKIERCHRGTLFLDEIGDLPLSSQAKLLRVLQEGEFERLGGSRPIEVDVRIIAATNKDLGQEVARGGFRKDLYWRLKVISVDMPPLRKRGADIRDLLEYFLARFGAEYEKPVHHVTEGALEKLNAYAWPGNVRELENCIRRAILLSSGDFVSEDHLLLESRDNDRAVTTGRDQLIARLREKVEEIIPDILRLSTDDTRADVIDLIKEILIEKALEQCGNNQVRAAKMLGISRNTLRHRLKKRTERS